MSEKKSRLAKPQSQMEARSIRARPPSCHRTAIAIAHLPCIGVRLPSCRKGSRNNGWASAPGNTIIARKQWRRIRSKAHSRVSSSASAPRPRAGRHSRAWLKYLRLQSSNHSAIINKSVRRKPGLSITPRHLGVRACAAIQKIARAASASGRPGWQLRWETRDEWPSRARILPRRAPP
jgi:hypothetical protein